MMRKAAHKQQSTVHNFPGLIQPRRKHAVNDNQVPMVGIILKHAGLMSLAFVVFYFIQLFV